MDNNGGAKPKTASSINTTSSSQQTGAGSNGHSSNSGTQTGGVPEPVRSSRLAAAGSRRYLPGLVGMPTRLRGYGASDNSSFLSPGGSVNSRLVDFPTTRSRLRQARHSSSSASPSSTVPCHNNSGAPLQDRYRVLPPMPSQTSRPDTARSLPWQMDRQDMRLRSLRFDPVPRILRGEMARGGGPLESPSGEVLPPITPVTPPILHQAAASPLLQGLISSSEDSDSDGCEDGDEDGDSPTVSLVQDPSSSSHQQQQPLTSTPGSASRGRAQAMEESGSGERGEPVEDFGLSLGRQAARLREASRIMMGGVIGLSGGGGVGRSITREPLGLRGGDGALGRDMPREALGLRGGGDTGTGMSREEALREAISLRRGSFDPSDDDTDLLAPVGFRRGYGMFLREPVHPRGGGGARIVPPSEDTLMGSVGLRGGDAAAGLMSLNPRELTNRDWGEGQGEPLLRSMGLPGAGLRTEDDLRQAMRRNSAHDRLLVSELFNSELELLMREDDTVARMLQGRFPFDDDDDYDDDDYDNDDGGGGRRGRDGGDDEDDGRGNNSSGGEGGGSGEDFGFSGGLDLSRSLNPSSSSFFNSVTPTGRRFRVPTIPPPRPARAEDNRGSGGMVTLSSLLDLPPVRQHAYSYLPHHSSSPSPTSSTSTGTNTTTNVVEPSALTPQAMDVFGVRRPRGMGASTNGYSVNRAGLRNTSNSSRGGGNNSSSHIMSNDSGINSSSSTSNSSSSSSIGNSSYGWQFGRRRPRPVSPNPFSMDSLMDDEEMDHLMDSSIGMMQPSTEDLMSLVNDTSLILLMLMMRGPDYLTTNEAGVDLNDYEALWDLAEQLGEVRQRGMTEEEVSQLPTRQFQPNQGAGGAAPDADEDEGACASAAAAEATAMSTETTAAITMMLEVVQCQICLVDFQGGDSVRCIPCSHDFHTECIDQWLKRNATCPICRQDVRAQEPDN